VEIDPKMTEVAKQYFGLQDDPRLTTYNEDGRVFLNTTNNKYDRVIVDAFKAYTPPSQLTTVESAQKIYDLLNDNGLVFINIISSINGETGKFFRAEYETYKKVFPQVYVVRVGDPSPDNVQNLLLFAIKGTDVPEFTDPNPETDAYLKLVYEGQQIASDIPELTDDFAPVNFYLIPVVENYSAID
jgi:spermidine synthase